MAAGGSASRRAQEARRQERLLREQWQAARQEARRWEAAGEGEQQVAAQLLILTQRGWRLLVDRRPGTRVAMVDMLLVDPGGVFVLDVKNWSAAPEIVDGRLRAQSEDRTPHVHKLLTMTRTAEGAVASLGLSPVAVRPLMVFAGRQVDATLGRVHLLGEREVGPMLLNEPRRLRPEGVRAIGDLLERAFPGYEGWSVPKPHPTPAAPEVPGDDGLFNL